MEFSESEPTYDAGEDRAAKAAHLVLERLQKYGTLHVGFLLAQCKGAGIDSNEATQGMLTLFRQKQIRVDSDIMGIVIVPNQISEGATSDAANQ